MITKTRNCESRDRGRLLSWRRPIGTLRDGHKEWLSRCGRYKIRYRSLVCGVHVAPIYQALALLPLRYRPANIGVVVAVARGAGPIRLEPDQRGGADDQRLFWTLLARNRRQPRTLAAAQQRCEAQAKRSLSAEV